MGLLSSAIQRIITKQKVKSADQYRIGQVKKNLSMLPEVRVLEKKQIREIQDYYVHLLGHKVPTLWHQYFYSRTGVFSKLYIPTSEYKNHIIGRLNVYPFHFSYNDKNITDITLPNTRQPKIYVKNMAGYFYSNGQAITRDQALDICSNLGDVMIKPSMRGRGLGVKKVHFFEGKETNSGVSISSLFDEYRYDYLVQAVVSQHALMSALNPSSINTLRLVTYRNEMDIFVVYSVIRIGRKGMNIDNESAGGISARINSDGTLCKYAYGAPGQDRIEYTDSGIKLEGYTIPSFEDALNFVKQSHLQLPYFNLIGWDIAIEEDGSPVMIELNLNPDLSQSANGPAFGEFTEMILKDAMNRNDSWTPETNFCMVKKNNRIK